MSISHARDRLGDFTTRPRMLLIAAMASVTGVFGALAAAALVWLIAHITALAYFQSLAANGLEPGLNHLGLWAIGVPVVGGLIIGLMARYGSDKIRGHGIPEALEAILIGRSRLSLKVAILKPLSSAIAIGTGGPFGAEGPIIMTGAALGSVFAQAFRVSANERKTLLVSGAAAGMAAIFNAPLASTLIAVELLLFEWKPRSFVPVAVAASVGAALRVPLLGAGAVFPTTAHAALPMSGLVIALGVGAVAGLAATGITWMVYASEDAFLKLPIHWMWWPAIGGVVVGLGGLVAPRALGVGYPVIRDLFAGHLVGGVVLALLAAKAVMWSVALGSGTSGGVLAPLLIMGGALGAAESGLIPMGDPGMWAIISTAAVMGGTMRSPLTAIVFLLELTHDVNLVGGLLVATAASHAVTVLLMRRSILTEKVARRGHHVMRELAVNPLALFRVDDVMHPPTATLPADTVLDSAFDRRVQDDPQLNRARAWPLVSPNGALAGILTRGDIERAHRASTDGARPAIEAGTTTLVVAYPEELLDEAMNAMIVHDLRQLPVVDRKSPTRLLGMIDASAVATAWSELRDEDHVREAGELTAAVRLFRRKVARLRAGLR